MITLWDNGEGTLTGLWEHFHHFMPCVYDLLATLVRIKHPKRRREHELNYAPMHLFAQTNSNVVHQFTTRQQNVYSQTADLKEAGLEGGRV
jgi:hypothetical protein